MTDTEEKPARRWRAGIRQPQKWTERAVARASRACPDHTIRILPSGVLELVPPPAAEATEPVPMREADAKAQPR